MDARFAIAARHSRMVRVLRVAVPAAVVLAMTAIVFVSVYNPFRMLLPKLPVDIGNLVVSGTKITMESPHMSGYTPDQRPYEVWAKTATQDLTDPDKVDLRTLRAKVLMEDRTTHITLDARSGLFDSKAQLLDLRKDIFLQSSTGYEARLSQALVDIGKSTVTSEEHVDVKLLNGTLSADRLRITGGGEVVRFEGNVVMNLDNLGTPEEAAAAPRPSRRATCQSTCQDTIGVRQIRQPEMILMMMFSRRSTSTRRIAHYACTAACALALLAAGEAARAKRGAGRAQRHAGFFAEPRPADPDRGRFAGDARQEKGSDLCRQCEGDPGRHHHDVEDASWCSTIRHRRPPRRRPPTPRRANAKAAKSAPMQAASPGPGGSSSIRRLEAKGNVVVTQKDQVVTGETAVFDTKANMITMLGGIVLTQGKNVLRGDRLMVDMATGVSRVESDSGRVQGLFISSGGGGAPAHPRDAAFDAGARAVAQSLK